MNLVQTNKSNAADNIRNDPDALKQIADKTWKIYGPQVQVRLGLCLILFNMV
jgi:hypothetical protein